MNKKYLDIIPISNNEYVFITDEYFLRRKTTKSGVEWKKQKRLKKTSKIIFVRGYIFIIESLFYLKKVLEQRYSKLNNSILLLPFAAIIFFLILPSLISVIVFQYLSNEFIANIIESFLRGFFTIIFLLLAKFEPTLNNLTRNIAGINIYTNNKQTNNHNWVAFLCNEFILMLLVSISTFNIDSGLKSLLRISVLLISFGINYEIVYNNNLFFRVLNFITLPLNTLIQLALIKSKKPKHINFKEKIGQETNGNK